MSRFPSRLDLLLGVAVLMLTVFFFVPYALLLNNLDGFFTDQKTFAAILLVVGCAAFGAAAIPLLFVSAPKRAYVVALLAFLSAGIWVQSYMLNWDYGVLDGADLQWRLFEGRTIIDLVAWVVLFLAIAISSVKRRSSFRTMFVILLLMQAGNLYFVGMGEKAVLPDEATTHKDTGINLQNQFVFSSTENLVLLLLDAYQTDIFNEYLERHPAYKNDLPGFIYFPDAITEVYFTEFSIPSMLTGKRLIRPLFENSQSYRAVMNDLLRNYSIPAVLKKAGYYVGIYTSYAHRYYPPAIYGAIADNYAEEEIFVPYYAGEMRSLMALTLFRMAPHILKKNIHHRFLLDAELEQDRDVFMHGIDHSMRVGTDTPCFKYYHLQGLHAPQIIDGEVLDWLERESALTIAGKVNEMLAKFVAKLQELDIYDNSTILIIADHGLYWNAQKIEYGQYADAHIDEKAAFATFVKKPRALPLVLFKPAQGQGPLTASRAPVCLSDIMPTIIEVAEIDDNDGYDGVSLFQAREDQQRIRRYYTNNYSKRLTDPVYEFTISGFSWFNASWTYTGNVYANAVANRVPLNNYQPGTLLTFGHVGSANQYLDEKWAPTGMSHRIEDTHASLSLPLVAPKQFMTLTVDLAPLSELSMTGAPIVSVHLNDRHVDEFTVTERQYVRVEIPNDPAWQAAQPPSPLQVSEARPWTAEAPVLSDAKLIIRFEIVDHEAGSNAGALPKPGLEFFSLRVDGAPE